MKNLLQSKKNSFGHFDSKLADFLFQPVDRNQSVIQQLTVIFTEPPLENLVYA